MEAVYEHEPATRQGAHWVMNTEWLLECRKVTDSSGYPVFIPSFSLNGPQLILGFPVEVRKDGGVPHLELRDP